MPDAPERYAQALIIWLPTPEHVVRSVTVQRETPAGILTPAEPANFSEVGPAELQTLVEQAAGAYVVEVGVPVPAHLRRPGQPERVWLPVAPKGAHVRIQAPPARPDAPGNGRPPLVVVPR